MVETLQVIAAGNGTDLKLLIAQPTPGWGERDLEQIDMSLGVEGNLVFAWLVHHLPTRTFNQVCKRILEDVDYNSRPTSLHTKIERLQKQLQAAVMGGVIDVVEVDQLLEDYEPEV